MRSIGLFFLAFPLLGATFTTQVVGVSPTQAVLAYDHSGACTLAISPSPTHTPVVNDVNASLFTGADTDTSRNDTLGTTIKQVTIGHRYTELSLTSVQTSRALAAATTYYGLTTCGADTSAYVFTTRNIPSGLTYNDVPEVDPATPGGFLFPTCTTRNCEVIDPKTGALLRRVTVTADKFGGSHGLTQGFGGITTPCASQLQTAPGGEQGYLCVFWQQDVGYGSLFFVVPQTGEWRNLGSVPNGAVNPSIDNLMDVYYFDFTPNGLYRMKYNGDFSENGGGAASFATRELYMQNTNDAGTQLSAFNSSFINDGTYDCGFVHAGSGQYGGFFCFPTGGSSQDVTGWLGVFYGGDGRVYDPTCSAGPSACPHVVASMDLVSRSCLNHNWQTVDPSNGVIAINTKSLDGNCTLGGFASMAFCNYLLDPNCTSAYVDAYWPYGGHDYLDGVLGRVTESGGWGVVFGQLPATANTPLIEMTDSPSFSGATGLGNGNFTSKHPSWIQSAAAPPNELKWFSDFTPYDGGDSPNPAAVSISGDLYSYTTSQPLARKQLETGASFAYQSLLDISGPGSSIGTGAGDNYKYCVAYAADECRSGSSVGDIFLNAPSPTALRCVGGDGPWPFNGDLCISNASSYSNGVIQRYAGENSSSISKSRLLTHGLGFWKWYYSFSTAKALPDASWMTFTTGLGLAGGDGGGGPYVYDINLWAVKLPTIDGRDSQNRTQFKQIPVKIPTTAGVDNAVVKFGYVENSPTHDYTDYFCTSRREACVAGTSDSPFSFETTDTFTGTSCSSGCTVSIPVIPGRTVIYEILLRNGSSVISTLGPQVAVVP